MEQLAYVAGLTKQIRIGTSILVTGYHRPVPLAKQAATLDVLTDGRFLLGVGLGWSRSEHALLDAPFERRGPRTTEMLKVIRACWGDNPVAFDGEFYSVPKSETSPKPVSRGIDGKPGVPIVAGFWAESAFPRIAGYCDYWQPVARDLDKVMAESAQINAIAKERFGRGPIPVMLRVFASPKLSGVREIAASPMQPNWVGGIDEMMPKLRAAKATGAYELIIDTSFFPENPGADGWLEQLEFFRPLLDEAHA
jgi:alkanesulfonate monooxygenase SsuD/methylene tetrahydromethanopterin reductase-like flavin-dependent oxidoreductase (luciferase family)